MGNSIKMDDLGVPPIVGNIRLYGCITKKTCCISRGLPILLLQWELHLTELEQKCGVLLKCDTLALIEVSADVAVAE